MLGHGKVFHKPSGVLGHSFVLPQDHSVAKMGDPLVVAALDTGGFVLAQGRSFFFFSDVGNLVCHKAHSKQIMALAALPGGRFASVLQSSTFLEEWKVDGETKRFCFLSKIELPHDFPARSLCSLLDGSLLVYNGRDCSLALFHHTDSWKVFWVERELTQSETIRLASLSDSTFLIYDSDSSRVRIHASDPPFKCLQTIDVQSDVRDLTVVSPEAIAVVPSGFAGFWMNFQPMNGIVICSQSLQYRAKLDFEDVDRVAFADDRILFSTKTGELNIWSRTSAKEVFSLPFSFHHISFLLNLSNGGVVVGGSDGTGVILSFTRVLWKLMRWAFLSNADPESALSIFPQEVIYHMVEVIVFAL